MASRDQHRDDHTRYQQFLESTRDTDGVVHRDQAVKLLAEELAEEIERVTQFAAERASRVADNFDAKHKPITDNGQMALDIDTYLVVGDSERVRIDFARPHHTRQWIDIQNIAKAKHDAAHAAKTLHAYKLLEIQDEHDCSLWEAEQIFRGGA